jgi:hypothetical protein
MTCKRITDVPFGFLRIPTTGVPHVEIKGTRPASERHQQRDVDRCGGMMAGRAGE